MRQFSKKHLASITPEERDAIYAHHIKVEYTQQLSWERILKIFLPLTFLILLLLYYNRKLHKVNAALHTAINALNETQKDLKIANNQLSKLSTTDTLTGLSNRYHLDETLQKEFKSAKRYGRSLSVIMIDLDYFKVVNDTYGHHAGDTVLKKTADILRQNCRQSDTVGRWGGEEFLILASDTTLENATLLAEKLRALIPSVAMLYAHTQTASFGVTSYIESDTPESLIRRSDEALYLAKDSGRNCVHVC